MLDSNIIKAKIMKKFYDEKKFNNKEKIKLKDVSASLNIGWTNFYPEAISLKNEGILDFEDLKGSANLTLEGFKNCKNKFDSDLTPELYKNPIPIKRKEQLIFISELNSELANLNPGNKDYILIKEKIDQVRYTLSQNNYKKTNLKSTFALIFTGVIVLITIISFIISLYPKP